MWTELPEQAKARITGKLLGDGGIIKQKGRKPRFQFTHCAKDKEWSGHCYTNLSDYIPLTEPSYNKITDPRLRKGYSERYICQSKTSPLVTYLHEQWYACEKVIPFHLIHDYMTPEALAWWYQDDGHLKMEGRKPAKIILSTESFTKQECLELIDLLYKKYNLLFSLDGQKRLVIYNRASINYFLFLTSPFHHSSMSRKMLKQKLRISPTPSKRTTLSIPANIILTKPTNQINQKLENLTEIFESIEQKEFYHRYQFIFRKKNVPSKKYQIVVNATNLSYLEALKRFTGLTYNDLALICFQEKRDPR
ncbi:endonuclease [Halobacillus locisalis]|uniref:endonuclease n=1 Tax=Halobacillus locisalis TaxID=220753 RepID=UPI0031B5D3FE